MPKSKRVTDLFTASDDGHGRRSSWFLPTTTTPETKGMNAAFLQLCFVLFCFGGGFCARAPRACLFTHSLLAAQVWSLLYTSSYCFIAVEFC